MSQPRPALLHQDKTRFRCAWLLAWWAAAGPSRPGRARRLVFAAGAPKLVAGTPGVEGALARTDRPGAGPRAEGPGLDLSLGHLRTQGVDRG